MPRFDYTSIGFYTFDCLARPVTEIPPGGDTYFVEDFTLAVSGAAGSASIVAAKHGLSVQAVTGVGDDDMGDWVLGKLKAFGVDTENVHRCPGVATSSSIVTTRPDGRRPALHKKGATGAFVLSEADVERATDSAIVHLGGVGLMDAMDGAPNAALMARAKAKGCTTTLDVFASTPDDLPLIEGLLPHTDYFMPSEEEAMALTGLTDFDAIADILLAKGVGCVILTLGAEGALYRHSDGTRFHIPAFAIEVVCTCGCGDCFNAGFATGLHLGLPPEECVRMGQAASAQNAMGLGSQAVVESLEGTQAFIARTPTRPTTFA
ncbi:MAG: carbohydrate kinase family protein [Pseudomonadota bacterium]